MRILYELKGVHIANFEVDLVQAVLNTVVYQLRNGKRAACNHGVMDARGRLLSKKEA